MSNDLKPQSVIFQGMVMKPMLSPGLILGGERLEPEKYDPDQERGQGGQDGFIKLSNPQQQPKSGALTLDDEIISPQGLAPIPGGNSDVVPMGMGSFIVLQFLMMIQFGIDIVKLQSEIAISFAMQVLGVAEVEYPPGSSIEAGNGSVLQTEDGQKIDISGQKVVVNSDGSVTLNGTTYKGATLDLANGSKIVYPDGQVAALPDDSVITINKDGSISNTYINTTTVKVDGVETVVAAGLAGTMFAVGVAAGEEKRKQFEAQMISDIVGGGISLASFGAGIGGLVKNNTAADEVDIKAAQVRVNYLKGEGLPTTGLNTVGNPTALQQQATTFQTKADSFTQARASDAATRREFLRSEARKLDTQRAGTTDGDEKLRISKEATELRSASASGKGDAEVEAFLDRKISEYRANADTNAADAQAAQRLQKRMTALENGVDFELIDRKTGQINRIEDDLTKNAAAMLQGDDKRIAAAQKAAQKKLDSLNAQAEQGIRTQNTFMMFVDLLSKSGTKAGEAWAAYVGGTTSALQAIYDAAKDQSQQALNMNEQSQEKAKQLAEKAIDAALQAASTMLTVLQSMTATRG